MRRTLFALVLLFGFVCTSYSQEYAEIVIDDYQNPYTFDDAPEWKVFWSIVLHDGDGNIVDSPAIVYTSKVTFITKYRDGREFADVIWLTAQSGNGIDGRNGTGTATKTRTGLVNYVKIEAWVGDASCPFLFYAGSWFGGGYPDEL